MKYLFRTLCLILYFPVIAIWIIMSVISIPVCYFIIKPVYFIVTGELYDDTPLMDFLGSGYFEKIEKILGYMASKNLI